MDLTIQNVSNYSGLYKEYPVNQTQNVSVEVNPQETVTTSPSEKEEVSLSAEEMNKAPKSADLENISLTFLAEDEFGYIGRDSDLENLDVMQAVSDMQKDSILHQYHTFVGADEPIFSSEDGMVFLK